MRGVVCSALGLRKGRMVIVSKELRSGGLWEKGGIEVAVLWGAFLHGGRQDDCGDDS